MTDVTPVGVHQPAKKDKKLANLNKKELKTVLTGLHDQTNIKDLAQ